MFKNYVCILLLAYLLGKFYFKKNNSKKEIRLKNCFNEILPYLIITMIIIFPVYSVNTVIVGLFSVLCHFLVEIFCVLYMMFFMKKARIKKSRQNIERNVFVYNQVLHVLVIIIIAYLAVHNNCILQQQNWVKDIFDTIPLSEQTILSWLIALLAIHKPANELISRLLANYRLSTTENTFKKDNNTGRFIGTVERMICLILISLGQYAAMGLVLTAKSIARYNKISEDKEFAEYYLLGTLLSILIVIVVSVIL